MTLAAYIDSTGVHAPTYTDILTQLQTAFQSIYGADIYLGNDSQDGQMLAIFASAINDCNSALVALYNAFSPATAQGAGLSSIVKINNIQRQASTNSTVDLTLTGTVGTIINNGIVKDANGYQWALPATVTIGTGGTVVATATCKTAGAISAAPGTVTTIATPTYGWLSVTNSASATVGADEETDAALRVRQALSTALAAETILGAIVSAVANVSGVTQVKAYENDTSTADANGIPGYSICLVVNGGAVLDVATAIASKKPPGTGTYGTTIQAVTDPVVGTAVTINFYRPTVATITVNITIKALAGFVSTTEPLIQDAIAAYISGIAIGGGNADAVEWGAIFGAATVAAYASTYSIQAITLSKNGGAYAAADVAIAFNELPSCVAAGVTITVV